tara:strand:+ start:138 stop:374 length:237 start_codon:yes stop_codon:yes gene_type:complete
LSPPLFLNNKKMNFIDFLNNLNPGHTKRAAKEYDKSKKDRFNIGGQSGFKWKTESANKTWVEGNTLVKENKGKTIPKY